MRLGPLAAILLLPPNYRRPVPVISGAHPLSKTPEPFLSPASGRWVSSKVESCTPRLGDACLPATRQASIIRSFGLPCPLGYGAFLRTLKPHVSCVLDPLVSVATTLTVCPPRESCLLL